MQQYIFRRLILTVPVMGAVALITFVLLHLVPGDVTMNYIAGGGSYSPERLEAIRHDLGLDRPLTEQFLRWTWNVLHGDFGRSLLTDQATWGTFVRAAPVTLELGLLSVLLGVLVAIPIGVISAVKQDSLVDHVARLIGTIGIAAPNFWLGTIVVVFLGLWFHYQIPTGFRSPLVDPWGNIQQFFFPALISGFSYSAVTMRLTRTAMLDVLRQDYIRTAYAKGLPARTVLIKHALRNALIPIVTVVGSQLSFLLGGTVILESIFTLNGVGMLTLTSVLSRDYTQVQTNVLLLSLVIVVGNLLTDLSYAWLDPRIKYS